MENLKCEKKRARKNELGTEYLECGSTDFTPIKSERNLFECNRCGWATDAAADNVFSEVKEVIDEKFDCINKAHFGKIVYKNQSKNIIAGLCFDLLRILAAHPEFTSEKDFAEMANYFADLKY